MRWFKVLLTIVAAVIAVAGGLITITAIAAGVLVLWVVQRWLGLVPPRKRAAGGLRSSPARSHARPSAGADVIEVTATEVAAEPRDR